MIHYTKHYLRILAFSKTNLKPAMFLADHWNMIFLGGGWGDHIYYEGKTTTTTNETGFAKMNNNTFPNSEHFYQLATGESADFFRSSLANIHLLAINSKIRADVNFHLLFVQ